MGNWQVEPIGVGVDIRSRGVWKYLPSGELAGRANRSPAELSAYAAAHWGADSPRGARGIRGASAFRFGLSIIKGMRDSQGIN